MNTYLISGIVNVNMYNSLLSPEFVLDDEERDESEVEALWQRFDVKAYTAAVCERAAIDLKKLLERLPVELGCRYVDGSAYIISPRFYNYGGDRLWFKIVANSVMTEKAMQTYLMEFFLAEWNAEFGPDYRICEYLRENRTIGDYQRDEEDL